MEFTTTGNSTNSFPLTAHNTGIVEDSDILNNNPFCDY